MALYHSKLIERVWPMLQHKLQRTQASHLALCCKAAMPALSVHSSFLDLFAMDIEQEHTFSQSRAKQEHC